MQDKATDGDRSDEIPLAPKYMDPLGYKKMTNFECTSLTEVKCIGLAAKDSWGKLFYAPTACAGIINNANNDPLILHNL